MAQDVIDELSIVGELAEQTLRYRPDSVCRWICVFKCGAGWCQGVVRRFHSASLKRFHDEGENSAGARWRKPLSHVCARWCVVANLASNWRLTKAATAGEGEFRYYVFCGSSYEAIASACRLWRGRSTTSSH